MGKEGNSLWRVEKHLLKARIFFIAFCILGVAVLVWIFYYLQVHNLQVHKKVGFDSNNYQSKKKYPPSSYFPKDLKPVFPDAQQKIKEMFAQDSRGITAESFSAMDKDTRELLLAKNIRERHHIASIAKVMTAIVSLENSSLDKLLTVSKSAAQIGEAEMGLTAGERLTVEELLYGLMLPSGNDAAETLAEGVIESRGNNPVNNRIAFIASMNRKAYELGMYDSFFANPTGLDEETEQESTYSTALDLLALGAYAMENKIFAKIAATKSISLPYKEGYHKAFYLENILGFDKSYPGIKGIKPGMTNFAKETLLSYAERDGRRVLVVLLRSDASKDDAVKIYKYLFGSRD